MQLEGVERVGLNATGRCGAIMQLGVERVGL